MQINNSCIINSPDAYDETNKSAQLMLLASCNKHDRMLFVFWRRKNECVEFIFQ